MEDKNEDQKEKPVKSAAGKELLLGIDLGTSRTAMMSNRGAKTMFKSVVGYPQDIIAVKLVQDVQVIGEKAIENASALDLRVPLENGVIKTDATEKDLNAVKALLEHAVQQAEPNPDDRVCAVIGVPAEASVKNVDTVLDIAKDIFDVALVASEPFLVAYSLNKIVNSIVIDIGAGTTDVCILQGALPGAKDQLTSMKAGDYLDRRLLQEISNNNPDVQLTKNMICKLKESHAFVGEEGENITVKFRKRGKPVQVEVSKEIRQVGEEIVPEIVELAEKLLIPFNPEKQEEVLQNIYLAGGGSQIKGLAGMIESQLQEYGEVKVTCVDNPAYAGCDGALKIASEIPPANWDQIGRVCGK